MTRAAYERVGIVKSPEALGAYAKAFPYCQSCGRRPGDSCWYAGRVQLHLHHIIKSGRSDEATNLLRVCLLCHDAAHLKTIRHPELGLVPKLTLGMQLELKRLRTPLLWDQGRLTKLNGGWLPPLETVPEHFQKLWEARRA